ncbi:MAG TPA: aspartyl protease family protein [Bacteroidales bacterium]|nr:aspartyl protease family protein [Bacteroidales bacterium]HPS17153.1 aspartyl protease family protein [Bacteroidales bacterium]
MKLKIPIEIIELEPESFHLFIEGHINGKPANMLVDTGASKTVFDLNRISNFINKRKKKFESFEKTTTGLGTNSMESHFTNFKKFNIKKLAFVDFKAILLDMTHVNQSYEMLKMKPIDGVLGSDLLMKYKSVIDYKKHIISFEY